MTQLSSRFAISAMPIKGFALSAIYKKEADLVNTLKKIKPINEAIDFNVFFEYYFDNMF
jgi:hypothetical protein